ncbi:putative toxin-antitoxin system toxin component, PIN family [Sphaerospermopsis kisseleviana CS-549]|uniref:Toxin-antitoxin system toxin component, PIN family n=1 Tax=Sphaerospermopsis kisseleviana CS-549 TaxID=3021783 RepID=A0ABT4ZXX6_9CYAN|nr:putative toxin-antitoxin system toxin component, PIN family [Sphaerospermopsis kisseleviana]MDB9444284.1 putative toxin-antitoxin system toxin component, PIN family [Sphaerospermopsis kisseleviana CS-549]BAZ82773.1 nucleotide binding protein PINc [Sphaerospermopsis kisseleviana NIES-73]
MKVVVDVNVLISALLWGGTPRKTLILAQNNQISIFASPDLFQELETTLKRTKFQAKIKSLGLTVEDILDATTEVLQTCPNISLDIDISQLRDMKDYHILSAAVSAQAEVLITGDQDLLVLNKFAEILIMTPADFLNTYFTSS